jgi:hypothetical protein
MPSPTMLTILLTLLSSLRLASAADDDPQYHNLGTIAFIRAGEHTPLLRPTPPLLTALGANQMYTLGHAFRQRYLTDEGTNHPMGVQRVQGLSAHVLVEQQLYVQTTDQAWQVASAQAFLQGLYPAAEGRRSEYDVWAGDVVGPLANGSGVQYPLGGYQYPNIRVLSDL